MIDNFLEIRIPEEHKGEKKLSQLVSLQLMTYDAQHTLTGEFTFNSSAITAQIFGKMQHFKKALKEFNFLGDKEVIEVRFSQSYPHIQFKFEDERFNRYHVVKFNSEIDDLVTK